MVSGEQTEEAGHGSDPALAATAGLQAWTSGQCHLQSISRAPQLPADPRVLELKFPRGPKLHTLD